MSTTVAGSKPLASGNPAVAPPTPQEIQRKLSLCAPPTASKRRASLSKSPTVPSALSGTESDSDVSTFSPPTANAPFVPDSSTINSAITQQSAIHHPQPVMQSPQLSVIAEKVASGEETDDDEDDDWRPAEDRSVLEAEALEDETVAKAGYLSKKGERRKTWKKRWFVLRQTQLSYYKSHKEYQLLRLLPISEIHCVTPVTLKRHAHAFGLVTPSRTYYCQASSPQEVDDWVKALNEARSRLKDPASPASPTTTGPVTAAASPTPAINVTSPKTPVTVAQNPPSSPIYHQATSSDSEDPDAPPISPLTVTFGTSPVQNAAGDADRKKPILQGYLMKCGSKRRNWRKRWFVLTQDRLIYAKSHMDVGKPAGRSVKEIPLDKILDAIECKAPKAGHFLGRHTAESKSADNAASGGVAPGPQTHSPSTSPAHGNIAESSALPQFASTFKIVTPKRSLILCAPSEEEEIKWLSAVRALIARRTGIIDAGQYASTSQPSASIASTTGQGHASSSKRNTVTSRREASGGSNSGSPPERHVEIVSPPVTLPQKELPSLMTAAASVPLASTSS
ncbi:hypothetical protein FRC03_009321 [Tulasnella sp. 419]|nr:hypothetical protein FRC03_009321 [Tulasnella sp. 419]